MIRFHCPRSGDERKKGPCQVATSFHYIAFLLKYLYFSPMSKNDQQPFINVSPKGENFKMEDCEFVSHGGDRPFISTQAKGTQVVRTKFTVVKAVRMAKEHPLRMLLTVLAAPLVIGVVHLFIEYGFFATHVPVTSTVVHVTDSPDAIAVAGNNNIVNKMDLPKPTVNLTPFQVNDPNSNPAIGYDSDYLLEVVSSYTIASFPIKIKLPASASRGSSMFRDNPATGDREFFESEQRDGYASYMIPNASGTYHFVFAHTQPATLTVNDLSW
jgi:hypothetical protein